MDKHTFVILAYKQSLYLEDCIHSLLNQSVKSKVVMATSTPSEWLSEVGEKYRLPIVIRQGESSIAEDWNFALSVCDTELLTLAHQDDLYSQTYTEQIMQSAQRFPDTLIFFTNNALLINDHRVDRTVNLTIQRVLLWPFRLKRHIRSKWVRHMTLSFGNPVCCPSVTYNQQNLDRLPGGFRFDQSFPNNLDWEAWIRLAHQKGAFVYERAILMTHRFHSDSETSNSLSGQKRQQDDRRMFSLLWPKPLDAAIAKLYSLAYRSKHA